MEDKCLFCDQAQMASRVVMGTKHFFVILDGYPVNEGHVLIVSKRHIPNFFFMNEDEWENLQVVFPRLKMLLDRQYNPEGYNIGSNCGSVAGQTIDHFHIHVIPRYDGDVENPRGGVRNFKKPLVEYPSPEDLNGC